MKGESINDTDEEKRPVGATFSDFDVSAVVDWEKYMCCFGKVRQRVAKGLGIRGLDEHKGHGGAE